MSESESDSNSDVSSFGNISVCEEISHLIERCEELYKHIDGSFVGLQNINTLITNTNNIMITYNDWSGDFGDLLESLHTKTLDDIKNKNNVVFGDILLNVINNSYFH